jgi:hypothetical protein
VFYTQKEATALIANCKKVVVGVVGYYVPDFNLREKPYR